MRGPVNKKRFFQTLAAINILLVILLVTTAYLLILTPYGQFFLHQVTGMRQTNSNTPNLVSNIHLMPSQNDYRIKKRQTLLGVAVTRIISQREPEEFLLLDGVSRPLVDQVYGQTPNLSWVNLIASQLLKMRQDGDTTSANNPSLEIKEIKTLNRGYLSLPLDKSTIAKSHFEQSKTQSVVSPIPYWRIEIEFKLSNEDQPRYYDAEVIRNIRSLWQPKLEEGAGETVSKAAGEKTVTTSSNARDTLLVGYAQKEVFQPELLSNLLQHLSLD